MADKYVDEIEILLKSNAKEVSDELTDLTQKTLTYKQAIKEVQDAQKELDKQYKNGEISMEQYAAGTAFLQKDLTDLNKSLNKTEGEIKMLNKASLDELWSGFKKGISACKSLKDVFGVVKTAASSLFKMLASNPWGAIATLIGVVLVGAFNKLKEAFKKNDDAGTALKRVFEMLKTPMKIVEKVISVLVGWFGKLANKVADAIKYISKFIPVLGDIVEAQDAIVVGQDKIEDAEREYAKNHAKRERQIAELRDKAADEETYNAEQRKKFLQEAAALEKKDAQEHLKLVNQKIAQEKLVNKTNNDTSDEAKNRMTELLEERERVNEELAKSDRKLTKEIRAINKQQVADNKEKNKAIEDAERDRRKTIQDIDDRRRQQEEANFRAQYEGLESYFAAVSLLEHDYKNKQAEIAAQITELQRQLTDKTLVKTKEDVEKIKALITALQIALANLSEKYLNDQAKLAEKYKGISGIEKALQDERLKSMQDGLDKQLAAENLAYERDIEALKSKYTKEQQETDEFHELLEQKRKNHEAKQQQIRDDASKKEADRREKELEEQKKHAEYTARQIAQSSNDILSSFASVAGSIADHYHQKYEEIVNGKDELSQEEAQRAIEALEREKEATKAQLILQQAVAIGNAIVAATSAASMSGPAAAFVYAATAASITAGLISSFIAANDAMKGIDEQIAAVKAKATGYATGGYIEGAGTATSDSIPARLSNGESVINARSTARFYDLLSAINQAGGGVAFPNAMSVPQLNFANGGVAQSYENTYKMIESAVARIQPVVSVKEITKVQNRLKTKEII